MCYAEETETCEIRPSVVITVVFSERERENLVIRPMLREEDLRRSKKILRKNLNLALASQRIS